MIEVKLSNKAVKPHILEIGYRYEGGDSFSHYISTISKSDMLKLYKLQEANACFEINEVEYESVEEYIQEHCQLIKTKPTHCFFLELDGSYSYSSSSFK